LADSSKLERDPEEDSGEKPEQVCCALSPGMMQAKRKLGVDYEFKENKVNVQNEFNFKRKSEV
jgi:hypothetical protein